MSEYPVPAVTEEKSEPPHPVRRMILEESSIIIAEEIARYINKIVPTPNGSVSGIKVYQVERFITEYFRHWYIENYNSVIVTTDAPWVKKGKGCSGGYFNVTIIISENFINQDTGRYQEGNEIYLTYKVVSEEIFEMGTKYNHWIVERKYVLYDS